MAPRPDSILRLRARAHAAQTSSRTLRLLGALLAGAVLLALAASSASAAAPPHSEFVGTQDWRRPTVSQWNQLGDANIRSFRVQLAWNEVELRRPTGCTPYACRRHAYDWTRYDRLFAEAARRRIRILPYLLGSPPWATADPRWAPVRYRPGYADWKRQAFYDFARAASERYGARGRFWRDNPELRRHPARHWQIWNEPNLQNYWWHERSGRRAAREYAALLKATSSQVRAGDSSARIVTAGMTTSTIASLPPPEFLRALFSVTGASSSVDFVALHPYARNPDALLENVRSARQALNRTSARARPLWLTEMGWSAGGPYSKFLAPGPEHQKAQASYLRITYRRLFETARSYGVHGAVWFSLADFAPRRPTRDRWFHHTGLFVRPGVPRVSWRAMRCVTGAGTCRY